MSLLIHDNSACAGTPIELLEPEILRFKIFEPILLLGKERFSNVDVRVRVSGGGHVSQVYGAQKEQWSLHPSAAAAASRWRRPEKSDAVPQYGGDADYAVQQQFMKARCSWHSVLLAVWLLQNGYRCTAWQDDRAYASAGTHSGANRGSYHGSSRGLIPFPHPSPFCDCHLSAIRQAIAKSIVAFYQKYVDEASKKQLKDILLTYDRTLLVADPRRCEPKKCASIAIQSCLLPLGLREIVFSPLTPGLQ